MPKYVETDFPIGQLSLLAEHESWRKEVYRPVYYIHKWWAKRIGSVFRGIILGACLNDNEDFFSAFYNKNNFSELTVLDPFMGSGVTIGEAIKLGCRAIGRDINPVATTIVKAALSRYSVDEVHEQYCLIENQVKKKIQPYYQTHSSNGELGDVLYFFHVKYLDCPQCGKEIELFNTRIFSKNAIPKKDPLARALCPYCHSINSIRFDATFVSCTVCCQKYNPQSGNVRKAIVNCPHCHHTFKLIDYMKNTSVPLPTKPYAKMVLLPNGQKSYEIINQYDKQVIQEVSKQFNLIKDHFPLIKIEPGHNTNQIIKHNYATWPEMFSQRQLISIWCFIKAINQITDSKLRCLFACLFSGVLEFNNLFCSFKGEGTGAVRHIFSHHILKPELMPIEANIWGTEKSSGSFSTLYKSRLLKALNYKNSPTEIQISNGKPFELNGINHPIQADIVDTYAEFNTHQASIYLSSGDSSTFDIPDKAIDLIITDPPFFDNVHYSQLADFFYYWLNQLLNISNKTTTREAAEVQDTNATLFTNKLTSVFAECHRLLHDKGLFIFTYHHSRHQGWLAIHQAIRQAGFACIQTYPIKAEMSVAVPLQQAKTPIRVDLIIVCKKQKTSKSNLIPQTIIKNALATASTQLKELAEYIDISLGDAKVTFMGRLLCELSLVGEFKKELNFLTHSKEKIEEKTNELLPNIINNNQRTIYNMTCQPTQLNLFD
jgi:putative DNA methylase